MEATAREGGIDLGVAGYLNKKISIILEDSISLIKKLLKLKTSY
jgi:hypothetical protein